MHEEGVFVCLLLGVCRARAIADRSRQADWNDGTVRVVGGGGVCEKEGIALLQGRFGCAVTGCSYLTLLLSVRNECSGIIWALNYN